ncbi:MAG: AAA family ATPase, partial [Burkholderiales bacterium]
MKRALDYLGWFTGAVGTLCIRYANNVLVICPAIALGLGLVGALVGIGVGLSMERTTGVADLNPLVGLSVRLGLVRWGDWWGHFAEGWWLLFVLAPWLPAITTAAWFSFGVAQMANGHLNQGLGHALAAAVAFVVFSMVALVAARAWALLGRLFAAAGSVMTSVSGTQPVDERPDAGRGKTQRAPSGESSEASVEQAIAYAVQTPRLDYSSMSGMQPLKEELLKAGREALAPGLQSRNGVLLFGRPGNGKTAMAEALAGELRVRFLSISIADLQSMWTGETTQRLVQVFRDARRQAPCVLLIDEIDSIISRRSGAGSDQEAGRTTNAVLTEVVNARGPGVLVIAATNFLESLDTAAVREGRFDWKIEVPVPDLDARIGLIMGTV